MNTMEIHSLSRTCEPADISSPENIGHFSLNGSKEDYYIRLDESNARWLAMNLIKDSIDVNLDDGLENYVPRDQPFNRIEPLLTWCMKMASDKCLSLEQVTHSANFVTDRTTLTKMAMIPYEENSYGSQWHCCRLGKTIFICPYRIEEEAKYYETPVQLKFSYEREKLRDLITVGYSGNSNRTRPVDGNVVFQHVNTVTIAADGTENKIMYSSQVDILEDKKPLEIRIQTEKLGRGVSWRNKAMKWYFQSVFSGAPQILVGIRPRRENYVESFKKFSIEKMRMEAEWEGNIWWSRKQCLGFVDQMLKRIQYELMKMPEQAALVVIHEPYSNIVNFVVDLENKNSFLTEEFLNQFGDTHLSTRWPIS